MACFALFSNSNIEVLHIELLMNVHILRNGRRGVTEIDAESFDFAVLPDLDRGEGVPQRVRRDLPFQHDPAGAAD